MKFKGTPWKAGWRRCGQMSEPDGIYITPWPHEEYPTWSVPALETAKCVAKQGRALVGLADLATYRAAVQEAQA